MMVCVQQRKHYLYFYTVLVFMVLAIIFTTALTAAGLSGDQTGKHTFEVRLASHEKVDGWKRVPGPGPEKTPVWISPEVALTNGDVAFAYSDRTPEGKPCVGIMFTKDGALKETRLTKSHVGEFAAIMIDGRVISAPKIRAEITGGRAIIEGNFTEEEASLLAKELSSAQTGKIKFELRLASHKQVERWNKVPGPGQGMVPIWISPDAALVNADIARAWPQPGADGFNVGFLLTEEGALKLARLTKSHIGENVAVILDGRVVTAPKIMDEITGGRAVISGNFTEEEAGAVAKGIMLK